jgi:hypothetical protein
MYSLIIGNSVLKIGSGLHNSHTAKVEVRLRMLRMLRMFTHVYAWYV